MAHSPTVAHPDPPLPPLPNIIANKEEAAPTRGEGLLASVGDVVAVALGVYVIANYFYPLPPLQERAIFALLVLALAFLRSASKPKRHILWKSLDLTFVALVIITFGYPVIYYGEISAAPTADSTNVVLGTVAIVVAIEATRRALSTALAVIVTLVLIYGMYGGYLPREYGGHGGFDVPRIVTTTYLGTEGMFGIVTYTLFKYIFLFVMFGRLLEHLGAMDFITITSRALLGRFRGGPAQVAVVSSGAMGSVNGSAIANVMVGGTVTIPLMKRLGYKPHVAGAIEAAASAGGQILPPVMGATAFLMAVIVGVPYLDVAKAALIPALLYFWGMAVAVYAYAQRHNIAKERKEDLPKLRSAFTDLSGLLFIGGLTVLVGMLMMGYSPTRAALFSMVGMIVVGMFHKNSRMTFPEGVRVIRETSDSFIPIGVAGPSVGVVVGIFLLSGIATRFAALVVDFTDGNLLYLAIFTMVISIILGTGLPTSVAYLILALTAAPALVLLDVPELAAHMFIFFAGMLAMITPPVGLASFAAATIAGADFWKTGAFAFLIGLPAYLIPYAFIYNQALLADGTAAEIAFATITTAGGVAFLAIALIGRVSAWESAAVRCLLFACAIAMIAPEPRSSIIGGAVGTAACVASVLWVRAHKERFAPPRQPGSVEDATTQAGGPPEADGHGELQGGQEHLENAPTEAGERTSRG